MRPKKSACFGMSKWAPLNPSIGYHDHTCGHGFIQQSPAGQEPFVHVYSKDGGSHRKKAPEDLFSATNLYTIKLPDGGRDLRLEHGLADLESGFALLRRDFLRERRKLPALRRVKFMAFVAARHARTPSFSEHHMRFWRDVQSQGERMERWIETATPQQKQRAASVSFPSSQRRSLSVDGECSAKSPKIQCNPPPPPPLAKSLRSAIRNNAADFANPDAFAQLTRAAIKARDRSNMLMSQRRSWLLRRQTADCASRPIKSLLLGAPSLIPDGLIVELHHLILGKRSKSQS